MSTIALHNRFTRNLLLWGIGSCTRFRIAMNSLSFARRTSRPGSLIRIGSKHGKLGAPRRSSQSRPFRSTYRETRYGTRLENLAGSPEGNLLKLTTAVVSFSHFSVWENPVFRRSENMIPSSSYSPLSEAIIVLALNRHSWQGTDATDTPTDTTHSDFSGFLICIIPHASLELVPQLVSRW